MSEPAESTDVASDDTPFRLGDIVETIKGAKFWGEIIAFDNDGKSAGCTVLAIDPGFAGTKHVYPLKQLIARITRAPITDAVDERAGSRFDHIAGLLRAKEDKLSHDTLALLTSLRAERDWAQSQHEKAGEQFSELSRLFQEQGVMDGNRITSAESSLAAEKAKVAELLAMIEGAAK